MNNVVQMPHASLATRLILNGEYRVAFGRHVLTNRFGRGSLELWFKITEFGDYFGREVCRYYKVAREGKRSFRVSPHSDYCREFGAIHGRRAGGIQSIGAYRDIYVIAEVRLVTKDRLQRPLPESAQYNVISRLIQRAEQ